MLAKFKTLQQSSAETAEVFRVKTKNTKKFYGYELLLAFKSSGLEIMRMNEEETESAKVIP